MEVKRCANCMAEVEGPVCGQCGFNMEANTQPLHCLKWDTILRGRYWVGRMLGQGGFGITYVGLDMVLNLKVAIKEYYPMGQVSRNGSISGGLRWNTSQAENGQWEAGCESFLKEARKMAKLNDIPEIVRVRDTFYENQTAYIVMDYVDGVTLKKWVLEHGTMSLDECISMLEPLMKGLDKVHRMGLIHRDISPDNIMIRPDGSACLLDLGAAKDLTVSRDGTSQLVTKKGFSPMEQYAESGRLGSWTDVYALCATIYYCVVGRVVPLAPDRVIQDSLSFPEGMRHPLSKEQEKALRKGLAVKPEDRTQTVEELLKELKDAGGNAPEPVPGPIPDDPVTKKKKWIPAVALTVVAAAAVLVICGIAAADPFRETVEALGNSNSNMLNDGGYAAVGDEYEYMLDHDQNLYVCAYDEEEHVFYIDQGVIAAENAAYINQGQDAVYFVRTPEEEGDYQICRMDPDGSNVEVLLEGEVCQFLQYARLTNGKEYLYFLRMDGEDSTRISRYDLESGEVQDVVSGVIWWFNLYEDAIYYTDIKEDEAVLAKSRLDGRREQILVQGEFYDAGFVEDGNMYMYSSNEKALLQLSLEGEKLDGIYGASMNADYYTFAYGDGWIYYVNDGDRSIHRIRSNGTGDELVAEDHYAISICYEDEWIWFYEGMEVDGEMDVTRAYLAYRDGSNLMTVGEATLRQTEEGLQYRLEGGSAIICGYAGESQDVAIPYTIDGYPVSDIEDNLPADKNYFLNAAEEDLLYELNEEEDGIIITGYTGTLTSFAVPSQVEGLPVVRIGDHAFYETEIEEVVLPRTVKSIGEYAFGFCRDLTYLGLPEGLEVIEAYGVECCYSLDMVQLPESLHTLEDQAFWGSGQTQMHIPAGLLEIGEGAFGYGGGSFEEITVSEDNPNYKAVDGVLFTADGTVLLCYPQGREGAYTVPDGVKEIGTLAFARNTDVTAVTLADTVESISDRAFLGCESLESMEIPDSVWYIANSAFADCDALEYLIVSEENTLFYEGDVEIERR